MVDNKIFIGSVRKLWTAVVSTQELLDGVCSTINKFYATNPYLLYLQAYLFTLAWSVLASIKISAAMETSNLTNFSVFLLQYGAVFLLYFVAFFPYLLFKAFSRSSGLRDDTNLQDRYHASPAMRAGVQWSLQVAISYFCDVAKEKSELADWKTFLAIFFLILTIISLGKAFGKLRCLGAADSLFGVLNVSLQEVLSEHPTWKLVCTILFAFVVCYREHRLKMKKTEDANLKQRKILQLISVIQGALREEIKSVREDRPFEESDYNARNANEICAQKLEHVVKQLEDLKQTAHQYPSSD